MNSKKKIKLKTRLKCFKKKSEWFIDLIEDHPFELGLSLALTLFGIRAFITGLQATPAAVQILPFGLAMAYCMLSVLGGVSVITGIIARVKYGWAYGLERFGLFVSASAWSSYIVGLVLTPLTGKSTLVIFALFALSIGCMLRARAINRKAKATLYALRYAQIDTRGE